jgi:polysaccharide biosynthesis protein PslH
LIRHACSTVRDDWAPLPVVMQRHQLLFVTEVVHYPLDRGNRIRIFNLLEACARQFEVTLVAPRPAAADVTLLSGRVARAVFFNAEEPTPFDWMRLRRALGSALGLPLSRKLISRMRLLHALERLDLDSFDLIWAEQAHIGRMFHAHRARTIVDFDDVTHRKLMKLMHLQAWSFGRLRNYYTYLVYRRAELLAFREYLRVMVCSREDQDYLRARGAGDVRVTPNGTALAGGERAVRSRAPGAALRAVFLGNMSASHNIDAVRFFADQVLARARGLIASFDVIGSEVAPEFMRAYGSRVNFRGFVDDLSAALLEYDVMVAPVRFGSGTKLKVLDAMASGVPLVSTPCGVEGLDLVDGVHALIASTPEQMLDALARLAASADFAAQLAGQAHQLVHRRFSWQAIQSSLGEDLADAARERAAASAS